MFELQQTNTSFPFIFKFIPSFFLNCSYIVFCFSMFFGLASEKKWHWANNQQKKFPEEPMGRAEKSRNVRKKKKATALPCYGLSNSPGSTFCRSSQGNLEAWLVGKPPEKNSYFIKTTTGVGCGLVVLWFCGFVVLWFCGFVVLWSCGFVVLWFCGCCCCCCWLLLVVVGCCWLLFIRFGGLSFLEFFLLIPLDFSRYEHGKQKLLVFQCVFFGSL